MTAPTWPEYFSDVQRRQGVVQMSSGDWTVREVGPDFVRLAHEEHPATLVVNYSAIHTVAESEHEPGAIRLTLMAHESGWWHLKR